MRTDRKRKVVEALLWAGSNDWLAVSEAALHYNIPTMQAATELHRQIRGPVNYDDIDLDYEVMATEAAYRLIESSPTLIREFFHRSAP